MKRKELLQSVKEVLFREWDPIGFNSNPACSDEYDSYASGIVRLLQAEADEYKIAGASSQFAARQHGDEFDK
jgi:hypothetical protein